jgi:hypothetical protein
MVDERHAEGSRVHAVVRRGLFGKLSWEGNCPAQFLKIERGKILQIAEFPPCKN